jgi:hypothetical protein
MYRYQERGPHRDQGREVVCTCSVTARGTAVQQSRERKTLTVLLMLSVGDTCIGIIENEYASVLAVLDTFARDTSKKCGKW